MAYRKPAALKRLWCTGVSAAQTAFDQARGEKGQQKSPADDNHLLDVDNIRGRLANGE